MPTPPDYITFGAPSFPEESIDEVIASIKDGWVGTGPKVAQFESRFAAYKDIPEDRVAAVNSCTAALHLSMLAAGIQPGDEVITTAMTFCATINAILHAGATPVLVDIDPNTLNINPDLIEEKITDRTRAILPVHFAGRLANMKKIVALCQKYNLKLIEDCAHAIEAEDNNLKSGLFGDFGCFSFYATKNITTAEGGMVVTRNPEDAAKIKTLALHGLSHDAWHRFSDSGHKMYLVTECGYKYNMTDIHAALGLSQLDHIDDLYKNRKQLWDTYCRDISHPDIQLPPGLPDDSTHALHLFTLNTKSRGQRDSLVQYLHEHNIGTGIHYPAIPDHPYYAERFGWKPPDYPSATLYGETTLSLPFSPYLTNEQTRHIINTLNDWTP
jgi:dTDP-4-amino-4,6-dideoxygalactose transaminase